MDLAFDIIGYSESLQSAGMPKAQADIIARNQERALEALLKQKDLATKADLEKLRMELEAKLDIQLARLEARLTKTLFNMLLGFAGAIGAFFAIAAFFLKS